MGLKELRQHTQLQKKQARLEQTYDDLGQHLEKVTGYIDALTFPHMSGAARYAASGVVLFSGGIILMAGLVAYYMAANLVRDAVEIKILSLKAAVRRSDKALSAPVVPQGTLDLQGRDLASMPAASSLASQVSLGGILARALQTGVQAIKDDAAFNAGRKADKQSTPNASRG